jgi:hypothetical protein
MSTRNMGENPWAQGTYEAKNLAQLRNMGENPWAQGTYEDKKPISTVKEHGRKPMSTSNMWSEKLWAQGTCEAKNCEHKEHVRQKPWAQGTCEAKYHAQGTCDTKNHEHKGTCETKNHELKEHVRNLGEKPLAQGTRTSEAKNLWEQRTCEAKNHEYKEHVRQKTIITRNIYREERSLWRTREAVQWTASIFLLSHEQCSCE